MKSLLSKIDSAFSELPSWVVVLLAVSGVLNLFSWFPNQTLGSIDRAFGQTSPLYRQCGNIKAGMTKAEVLNVLAPFQPERVVIDRSKPHDDPSNIISQAGGDALTFSGAGWFGSVGCNVGFDSSDDNARVVVVGRGASPF